jgi:hypothetical protein
MYLSRSLVTVFTMLLICTPVPIHAVEPGQLPIDSVVAEQVAQTARKYRRPRPDYTLLLTEAVTELKYMRTAVNINTEERTRNAVSIANNTGGIDSNGNGITLNRGLLLAVVGVLFWCMQQLKKPRPKPKQRIIRP